MFTTVSEAAKMTGVTRRTIQRWIKAGKVTKLHLEPSPEGDQGGLVSVPQCTKCRVRQRTGRKAKGTLWDNPLFWAVKESPATAQAEPFMQQGKLERLQEVLAIIAFWHVQAGNGKTFIEALNQVVHLTAKMEQGKRDDDPMWKAATGRFLNSISQRGESRP